jgi:uncharacterized protein (DUF1778 family)
MLLFWVHDAYMGKESRIRFETGKDLELVRKAAKSQKRSMNQFMVLACLQAAGYALEAEANDPLALRFKCFDPNPTGKSA